MAEVPVGEHSTFSLLDLVTLALILEVIPAFNRGDIVTGLVLLWLAFANHAIGVRWKISRYVIPLAMATLLIYSGKWCLGMTAPMRYLVAAAIGAVVLPLGVAAYSWIEHRGSSPIVQSPSVASSLSIDAIDHIEQLLSSVSDSEYRKLVAAVILAIDPHVDISVGNLISTPDGTRAVDIEARTLKDGSPFLVAFDVVDLSNGQKAGVELIDAADSKRADIKADAIVICSNTGFEELAINKAKRKNIGLISVLRQGDERIKAQIEEQLYFRKIDITPFQITWNADKPGVLQNLNPDPDVLEYNGGSVPAWMQLKATLIAAANPRLDFPIQSTFTFRQLTTFYKNGKPVTLKSMAISFHPKVQWFSEIVKLEATTSIYDYIRGRLRFPSGNASFTVGPIDWDKGTPLASPPQTGDMGVGIKPELLPGEAMLSMLANVHGSPTKDTKIADLDSLIEPADLKLQIAKHDLKKLRKQYESTK